LRNTKTSIFGGISKFCLWTDFGKLGQIWADFATFTVAESMLELRLKSSKPHNFLTVSPNVTCNGSLESYHPYLLPQKVSKNPKIYCIHSSLPKDAKTHFGYQCSLGVNQILDLIW
jgi:hypothetical protein